MINLSITAPGGVWIQTVVVTTDIGYVGPLTNVVRVTSVEGVTGIFTATSLPQDLPAIAISKEAIPDPVDAGEQLTYTLYVTNTGNVALHAVITDILPSHVQVGAIAGETAVLPGGNLVWTATLPAGGDTWTQMVVVTVETGYSGVLSNVIQVTTDQGISDMYTAITKVTQYRLYLPLLLRSF
ncbi:MAG: DUF11 domain-containing protein [Anaerolineae bacterium]|nr:DUF11 domain-containing protein [Anaerolineae bacterium]